MSKETRCYEQAKCKIFESNSGSLFITCHGARESSSNIWFLDSGCSNHMTGNKELFENLDT